MEGLNYITDEKGERKALIINLEDYGKYIEDILISYKRQAEKRISFDQVKENLDNKMKVN